MSKSEDNIVPPKDFTSLLGSASAQITFDNMTKLCNQNEYEVEGIKYKRKILKPKELVALYKLQSALDKIEDPQKRMDNIKDQAKLCLTIQEGKDFDKEWENTDAVMMEIIVGACLLISKGFRTV